MKPSLQALYGLKYNPFTQDVPTEALLIYPKLEDFYWRMEHSFIKEGGFALITGDPGTGKSAVLRILSERLSVIRDIQVATLTRPSARIADFYRELGDIFSVPLNPHNRWRGFKQLRECWVEHLSKTLVHPVLLIDEAQEMPNCVLNELRLLTSSHFDSKLLLSVIIAGDRRFTDKLRHDELLPLGSRIRMRFTTEYADTELLQKTLHHLLRDAGAPHLMTPQLIHTLCDHAMGNYRALCVMAGELLVFAVQQEKKQLDEALYLDYFKPSSTPRKKNAGGYHG